MALSNINFDDIAEASLSEHVIAGIPDGVPIDYRRDMYGRRDDDIKEF